MKNIKAVIFDLDGTIAETIPLCIAAFKKALEPLVHQTFSDEEIEATFGPSEEGTVRQLAPQHVQQGVADFLKYYKALHYMCPEPYNGIKELLEWLKSKQIFVALVTGKGKESTGISLAQFGLTKMFDSIENGSPEAVVKDKRIQDILGGLKDVSTNEVVYIGDSPSDIEACRKIGVTVIAAAWAATAKVDKLKALKPDEMFYSVNEFANWLKQRIADNTKH